MLTNFLHKTENATSLVIKYEMPIKLGRLTFALRPLELLLEPHLPTIVL